MTINTENLQIEEDILFITTGKYKLFLSHGKVGMDAFLLYMHFMFTCRLQQTNSIWANDVYVRQGLNWTRPKLQKAKNLLLDLDLISTKRTRNEDGTLGKTYVIVKTKTSMLEFKDNHMYDNQQVDKPADGNRTTNALTKKEMLKQTNKKGVVEKSDSYLLIEQKFKDFYKSKYGYDYLEERRKYGSKLEKLSKQVESIPDYPSLIDTKLIDMYNMSTKSAYWNLDLYAFCDRFSKIVDNSKNKKHIDSSKIKLYTDN